MLIRPTLLREPSGKPLFNLFLRNNPASAYVGETLRDLLLDVDVVLDVLERRIVRKLAKEFLHFLFGCLHRNLQRVFNVQYCNSGDSEKNTKPTCPTRQPSALTELAQRLLYPSTSLGRAP